MRRTGLIRALAGVLLAVFASVAVTLPIHLSSAGHAAEYGVSAAGDGEGCLFLQFLSEAFSSGDAAPEVAVPVGAGKPLLARNAPQCPLPLLSLPALRAPPFSSATA